MDDGVVKRLRLDVARHDGTLSGQVGIDGRQLRRFTGWIALNAAIEDLLEDDVADGPAIGADPHLRK